MKVSRGALLPALLLAACSSSSSDGGPSTTPPVATPQPPQVSQPAPPSRPPECEAQDTVLQAAIDGARKSPSAVLAVKNAACGTTAYFSGDAKNGDKDSLWRIGSVTKTFVSAVILSLLDEQKLTLDDPISKYVTGIPSGDSITLTMLLAHTSGLYNYTEAFGFDETKTYTPADLVALATGAQPYFAPGQGFHYSNTNYVLLGMVAAQVGGAKISALVRTRALEKAKLAHTFFDGEETPIGTIGKGFGVSGADETNQVNMTGPWAAGAMVATASDLVEWATTLYATDAILSAPTRALMTANAGANQYGLGVIVLPASVTLGGGVGLGHDGQIDGYNTQMFYFAAKETAIAAIVDQDGTDANDISLAALKVLFEK